MSGSAIGSVLSLLNFTATYWFLRCMALLSEDFPKAECPKVKLNWIRFKIHRVLPWLVLHPATKFHGNQDERFCAILLMAFLVRRHIQENGATVHKQTNK